jgi:Protein of unknown function (DUF2934)
MAKRTTRSTTPKTSNYSDTYASEPASADRASDMRVQGGDATRNDSMGSEPSEDDIRIRAYRRYLERGGEDGQHFEDWLEAERELKTTR